MNKPLDLLLHLAQMTDWGASYVTPDDLPGVLLIVYGDPSGQDEGALLACNNDMDACVRLGWVQKHERAGWPVFVLTKPGKAVAQIAALTGTGEQTPLGPV